MDRLTDTAAAAVAAVDGRLIVTPHALTLAGQTNVPADLQPGESLLSFLERHLPGLHSGAWAVYINDIQVPREQWRYVKPKHGTVIAVRSVVQRAALQLVAVAALSYFTMGMGGMAAGSFLGMSGAAGWLAAGVAYAGGSMLINKVLAPKVKTPAAGEQDPVYALGSARNSVRQYEPIPLLLGEVRYAPDYASVPYTWFESNDQYLATILHAGINVHSYSAIENGNTPLSDYSDVELYNAGFVGMPEQPMPLHSNPDTTSGAELEVPPGNAYSNGSLWSVYGAWVQRTSSADTVELQIDIEAQLYDTHNSGVGENAVNLQIEYAPTGTGAWVAQPVVRLAHSKTSALRRTVSITVPRGQYDVRVRSSTAGWDDSGDVHQIQWTQLKSIQTDEANYEGLARIGIKIKATGQLNGSLDEIRILARAESIPCWNGTQWIDADSRSNGLSNPGAQILQLLRGIYRQGRLVAGLGLPDSMIDLPSMQAFMLHCAARGLTFDAVISDSRSIGELLESVALAGLGQMARVGGRLGVTWAWSDQPISGVVNMATMKAGSFGVNYTLANAADGIEYTYFDRVAWENRTIRVSAPGITTPINPSRISGEGVTDAAHAALLARYHLGQSLYQYKDISYETDLEHLDYRRMSVLAISHDMTKWGQGGRLTGAARAGGGAVLHVDEPITGGISHIGVRVPGESMYRVMPCSVIEGGAAVSVANWPADALLPGEGADNPAHDTIWIADFRATPGYRVRVVSVQPGADMGGATVAVVPESPEFWAYVQTGAYEPVGPHTPLPASVLPVASNLRITEMLVETGESDLTIAFDIEGDYDHAEIWAAPDGQDASLVATTRTRQATWRVTQGGRYLVQVRPFSPVRAGPIASLLYTTQAPAGAPANFDEFDVQEVEGGLRRYVFAYTTTDRPINLAGAEIRYASGTMAAPQWDAMTPLGGGDGFFTSDVESVLPPAGAWTFALRARSRSGALSDTARITHATLAPNFDQQQTVDTTPPPAPTGVSATVSFDTVHIAWHAAAYDVGHGHAATEIYVDGTRVAEVYAGPYSITLPAPATYSITLKHRSRDGIQSAASVAVAITTEVDIAQRLKDLEDRITHDQLAQDLLAPIGRIDDNSPGSVNARLAAEAQARADALAQEAQARAAAINHEASLRAQSVAALADQLDESAEEMMAAVDAIQAQVSDIIGASEYDPAQAYETGVLVKIDGKLYRSKRSVPAGNPPPAATYWELVGDYASLGEAVAAHSVRLAEHESRISQSESGLVAEIAARDALAVQLRGNYTGTDLGQVSSGLVFAERTARVQGDTANAQLIQGVRADLTDVEGEQAAQANAISRWQAEVTDIDGRLVSQASQMDAVQTSLARLSGQNLVFNPSFEVGGGALSDGWSIVNSHSSGMSVESERVQSWLDGGMAQRLAITSSAAGRYSVLRNPDSLTYAIPDEATAFTLSAYIRGTPSHSVQLVIRSFTASGAYLANHLSAQIAIPEAGARLTHTVLRSAMAATAARLHVAIWIRSPSADAQTGWMEVDRVQLEIGTTATQWADNGRAELGAKADASAVAELSGRVAENEQGIESVSRDVVSLGNDVIAVVGEASRNLALNPDFELGTGNLAESWTSVSLNAAISSSITTSWIDGSRAQKMEMTVRSANAYGLFRHPNSVLIPIDPARPLTVSAYVQADSALDVQLHIQTISTSGTVTLHAGDRIAGNPEGTRQAYTLQPSAYPAGTAFARPAIWLRARGNDEGTVGAMAVDRVQLEQTAFASDWKPNTAEQIAANSAALSSLDSRVQAAEGSLTSQSGQITALNNSLTTTTTTANNAQAAAQAASTLAGGKGEVIYGSSAPVAAKRLAQNLWIDTTGNANTPKRWNGSAWVAVTDKVATDAAAAAAAAQAQVATKADASALATTNSKVAEVDGKVTSQSEQLVLLNNSLTTTTTTANNAQAAAQANSDALSSMDSRVTSLDGRVTSTSNDVTRLENAVRSQDFGRNLAINPDFELVTTGSGIADSWAVARSTTVGQSVVADIVTSWLDGSKAQRLVATYTQTGNRFVVLRMPDGLWIRAEPDTPYVLSAYVAADEKLDVGLVLRTFTENGTFRTNLYGPKQQGSPIVTRLEYSRTSAQLGIPTGTVWLHVGVAVYSRDVLGSFQAVIDNVQLEKASTASAWVPNVRSSLALTANAANANTSSIALVDGKATAAASSATALTGRVEATEEGLAGVQDGLNNLASTFGDQLTAQFNSISWLDGEVRRVDGQLSTVATSVTQLEAMMGDGVTNMIDSPQFASGLDEWTFEGLGGAHTLWSFVPGNPNLTTEGISSLLIETAQSTPQMTVRAKSRYISVQPNDWYWLSVRGLSINPASGIRVLIFWYTATGTTDIGVSVGEFNAKTVPGNLPRPIGDFALISVKGRAPANARRCKVAFDFEAQAGGQGVYKGALVTNVMFSQSKEDVAVPPEFSPAPSARAAIQNSSVAEVGVSGFPETTTMLRQEITYNGVRYSAGWALGISQSGSGGLQSKFLVNADTFAVLNGATATAPFFVQDNVVYMRSAMIQDATMSFAKISNDIQSTSMINGQPRWQINKSGDIVMRSGSLQNSDNSSFVNLNAIGTQRFVQVAGDTMFVQADGRIVTKNFINSSPNTIASGTITLPHDMAMNVEQTNSDQGLEMQVYSAWFDIAINLPASEDSEYTSDYSMVVSPSGVWSLEWGWFAGTPQMTATLGDGTASRFWIEAQKADERSYSYSGTSPKNTPAVFNISTNAGTRKYRVRVGIRVRFTDNRLSWLSFIGGKSIK